MNPLFRRRQIVAPKVFQEKYKSKVLEKRKKRKQQEAPALINELSGFFRFKLRAGFASDKDILHEAYDNILQKKEPRYKYKKLARKIMEYEIKILEAEQITWPSETDFDRLEKVYAELESEKILCRHNYTFSGYDGNIRLKEEYQRILENGGPEPIGYVFYHKQDTDFLVKPEPANMLFNYGSFQGKGEKPMLSIGKKLVNCLKKHGFTVEWDGTLVQRIGTQMLWRKRRLGAEGSHQY